MYLLWIILLGIGRCCSSPIFDVAAYEHDVVIQGGAWLQTWMVRHPQFNITDKLLTDVVQNTTAVSTSCQPILGAVLYDEALKRFPVSEINGQMGPYLLRQFLADEYVHITVTTTGCKWRTSHCSCFLSSRPLSYFGRCFCTLRDAIEAACVGFYDQSPQTMTWTWQARWIVNTCGYRWALVNFKCSGYYCKNITLK